MDPFTLDAISQIRAAQSALEVWAKTTDALRKIGFGRFVYSFQSLKDSQLSLVQDNGSISSVHDHEATHAVSSGCGITFFDNFPVDFNDRYWAEGFVNHDPAIPYCRRRLVPTTGWTNPDNLSGHRMAQHLAEEMQGVGCQSGLVIPFLGAQLNGFGGAGIYHEAGEGEYSILMSHHKLSVLYILLCAHLCIQKRLTESATAQSGLTLREREILHWAALGLESETIGDRLGLSQATVNFHISKAMKKLGAATRAQAVARAIVEGLITQ